jgi:hypothetical protein
VKEGASPAAENRPVTGRQQALIHVIQSLDPAMRHTLQIECRGTEPWNISKVLEHLNIRIEPKRNH